MIDLDYLENILATKIISTEKLNGGSEGETYLIIDDSSRKYIYKTDSEELITMQGEFYKTYSNSSFLPEIIYSNPKEGHLIISYIDQNKSVIYNKGNLLKELLGKFILHYKEIESPFYGFLSKYIQGATYSDFLKTQAKEAYQRIDSELGPDSLQEVLDLITDVYTDDSFSRKYLLHGDLGFHNISHTENNITGIIDPDPIAGHPIYDLLFMFCSRPWQFNPDDLDELLKQLSKVFPVNLSNSRSYLKIALFKRISSCKKHHPNDLDEYLKIWKSLGSVK